MDWGKLEWVGIQWTGLGAIGMDWVQDDGLGPTAGVEPLICVTTFSQKPLHK